MTNLEWNARSINQVLSAWPQNVTVIYEEGPLDSLATVLLRTSFVSRPTNLATTPNKCVFPRPRT